MEKIPIEQYKKEFGAVLLWNKTWNNPVVGKQDCFGEFCLVFSSGSFIRDSDCNYHEPCGDAIFSAKEGGFLETAQDSATHFIIISSA